MRIEVLTVGDELLDGRVADTNTVYLGRTLSELGHSIVQRTSVTDDVDVIVRAAKEAVARGAQLCVVSGGLGPTGDDVTADAFAAWTGQPLVRDKDVVAALRERFSRRGFELTENQLRQADRPTGATLLANERGTAPGFEIVVEGCRFVCVPGVPSEFRDMLERTLLADLHRAATPVVKRVLRVFGLTEGAVGQKLHDIPEHFPGVRVGYRARMPEIHVTLSVRGDDVEVLEAALRASSDRLGENVFAQSDIGLPAVVVASLRERGETLAAAESCTGGRIGDLVTNVPGSSDVFLASVVAYQNAIKERWLGVDRGALDLHGAVSEPTVQQMAAGVRERTGATWAVSASGIAGPSGGTDDKPVGTVWLAVAGPVSQTRKLSLPFDREGNKLVSAYAALDLVRRCIDASESGHHSG